LTIKIRVLMSDAGVTLSQVKSYRGWYANFIVVNPRQEGAQVRDRRQ